MDQIELSSAAESSTVLSNAQRREALRVLRAAGAPMALADLAVDVVDDGRRGRGDAPVYEAIQHCRLMLYHVHVPKLVDAGAVEFDPERQVVAAA